MLGWELALLVKSLEGPLMAVKYSWLLFALPSGETCGQKGSEANPGPGKRVGQGWLEVLSTASSALGALSAPLRRGEQPRLGEGGQRGGLGS